ncbi:hypothetical protein AB4Y45_34105 [Paraburkholderia sp. EG287A]|uniref:hypothetical protein n=1 Tax=Paraburkholderia sp. EG287A TaxID=3237012 RepID=UPI0034D2B2F4
MSSLAGPDALVRFAQEAGFAFPGAAFLPKHDMAACKARLCIGRQVIPVRVVANEPGAEKLLAQVAREMDSDLEHLESIVLMRGFDDAQIAHFQTRISRWNRRHIACSESGYEEWTKGRLGPIATLPVYSKLRFMLEPFASFSIAPVSAVKMADLKYSRKHEKSKINPDLLRGAEGAQGITTLLQAVLPEGDVLNVEDDKTSQGRGVDIVVTGYCGGRRCAWIFTDVKTEKYPDTYSFELIGNKSKPKEKQRGWFWDSNMDILTSVAWPSGTVCFIDLGVIREWVKNREWIKEREHGVFETDGSSPHQTYKSRVLVVPMKVLLARFPHAACFLSLPEWLPHLYGKKFENPPGFLKNYPHRVLVPQRPGTQVYLPKKAGTDS